MTPVEARALSQLLGRLTHMSEAEALWAHALIKRLTVDERPTEEGIKHESRTTGD